ncbi:MAG: amidohydrolase [Eubacteriales bacterium]
MLLLKNAKILTMAGKDYECGDILIKDGKFAKVAGEIESEGCKVIDLSGKIVMPGIIDAHCHIGMWEDGMDFEGADGNEECEPLTPELMAIDAVNPFDRAFTEARNAGVTTVVTGPGSANVIGGQFVALKTVGTSVDEMIIKQPAALKVAFGENPKRVFSEEKKSPMTRMATAAMLRQTLTEAQEYKKSIDRAKKKEEDPPEKDFKKEAVLPAITGELMVKAHAHRADDILTAIRIAREFNLKLSIDHCTEGYLIPEYVKKSGAKVILGPLLTERAKIELKNLTFAAPKIMAENGIPFAIMTDHPVIPIQHILISVALAVKEGLDEKTALESVTINAAKCCELEDRVGSIEAGKDADLVIFNGPPLDISSRVKMVLIDGNVVFEEK